MGRWKESIPPLHLESYRAKKRGGKTKGGWRDREVKRAKGGSGREIVRGTARLINGRLRFRGRRRNLDSARKKERRERVRGSSQ